MTVSVAANDGNEKQQVVNLPIREISRFEPLEERSWIQTHWAGEGWGVSP